MRDVKSYLFVFALSLVQPLSLAYAAGDNVAADLKKMIIVDQRDLMRFSSTVVENSKALRRIISEVGWPGIHKYGQEVEGNAVIICLHSENDRDLQMKCLELVKAAASTGDAQLADIAYLTDKLAVNAGEKQTFGTQGYIDQQGCWQPKSLLDPKNVESLRAKYAMQSLESYRKEMNANLEFCKTP